MEHKSIDHLIDWLTPFTKNGSEHSQSYEGDMVNGSMEGQGTLYQDDGTISGEWKGGVPHGTAVVTPLEGLPRMFKFERGNVVMEYLYYRWGHPYSSTGDFGIIYNIIIYLYIYIIRIIRINV